MSHWSIYFRPFLVHTSEFPYVPGHRNSSSHFTLRSEVSLQSSTPSGQPLEPFVFPIFVPWISWKSILILAKNACAIHPSPHFLHAHCHSDCGKHSSLGNVFLASSYNSECIYHRITARSHVQVIYNINLMLHVSILLFINYK